MTYISFRERLGLENNKVIKEDFPLITRNALLIIIKRLIDNNFIWNGAKRLREELYFIAREEYIEDIEGKYFDDFKKLLLKIEWYKVYILCERIYSRYLEDVFGYNDEVIETRQELQNKFSEDVNILLAEDGLSFTFQNGEFYRRGRAITQKNIKQMGSVLSDEKMKLVKGHYNRAVSFFRNTQTPDYANSIKESMCALELTLEVLSGENTSKDFAKYMKI